MIGGFYNYTMGSLNLVPEVQYVVAKRNYDLGLYKQSSNFGAAVFADYSLGTSPYSVGAWLEYENSNGQDDWFIGPGSQSRWRSGHTDPGSIRICSRARQRRRFVSFTKQV